MSDLIPLREKIDAIDTELLRLLNDRANVAKEIGTIQLARVFRSILRNGKTSSSAA